MQKYVASPKADMSGWYVVERWDNTINQYKPLKGEEYPTEKQAKERATELNKMDNEDNQEGGMK